MSKETKTEFVVFSSKLGNTTVKISQEKGYAEWVLNQNKEDE